MVTPRVLRSPGELLLGAGLTALLGAFLFLACNRDSKEAQIVGPAEPTTEEVSRGPLSPASLTLPFSATASSGVPLFSLHQTGTGLSGVFEIDRSNNAVPALFGRTNGSGTGVVGWNTGSGGAGVFRIIRRGNPSPALDVFTPGTGPALKAINEGSGNAIFGGNNGLGAAARFGITSARNPSPAVDINTFGTGPALEVNRFSEGSLAVFQFFNSNRIRFTHSGKGIFNGGTQTGGADVAEAMAVEGRVNAYEPGDVLVISTRSDRTVEKAAEPYSTRVIGVYATKPGVLLTERGVDDSLEGMVPVGVIGVIPTKVSAENGPIRRGDILVTGSRPGHAMRASPVVIQGVTLYPTGAILGKAMEEFRGPGTGMIRVLVNVK